MENKEKIFKSILSEYQDMIYRLCCSYVKDVDARKDLYQSILIRLWKGLTSFENRSSIGTWVYRISVNTSLDFLRTEFRKKSKSKHIDINYIEIADQSNNLEEDLIISERTKLMYKCINELSFVDKTIISLYLEDFSYREIAEIIGISEKNVSVKLVRIKKNLNECLRDV
jgi:RNA polymerase sigma-70 factor (ECF subfamily)